MHQHKTENGRGMPVLHKAVVNQHCKILEALPPFRSKFQDFQ